MDSVDYNTNNTTTSFTTANYSNSPTTQMQNNYNNDNSFVYEHSYNNGNVASSTALLEEEQLNSCLKKPQKNNNNINHNNSNSMGNSSIDHNNTLDKLPPEDVYPVMAKPSPSLQIIATRNRPCCECIRYNQRAPLCLLFLIFIVVSCSLITGVMFYLKSGR